MLKLLEAVKASSLFQPVDDTEAKRRSAAHDQAMFDHYYEADTKLSGRFLGKYEYEPLGNNEYHKVSWQSISALGTISTASVFRSIVGVNLGSLSIDFKPKNPINVKETYEKMVAAAKVSPGKPASLIFEDIFGHPTKIHFWSPSKQWPFNKTYITMAREKYEQTT